MEERTRFKQVKSASRVSEKLPDGSIAFLDSETKQVCFLNTSAAAAWEACREEANVQSIARSMRATLGLPVTHEAAIAALAKLEENNLVEVTGTVDEALLASRRSVLKTVSALGGALAPVVLAMTAADQKVYAQSNGSGTTTTSTTTTTTTSTTTTTTTPGVVVSDRRLKEDTRLLTSVFGLNLYSFRFIGSPELRVGLMAQEVFEQYPEAVIRGGADARRDPWKIDYAALTRSLGHRQGHVLQELATANS
jgi:Chaperone of endosialidase